jgi:poly-gamma-glutamate capsule biosynthesis protein CapA/YwtB (metallophosphatase superfamily)
MRPVRLALLSLALAAPVAADPVRIVHVGDTMPHSLEHAPGSDGPWDVRTVRTIADADIAIANLEGVLMDAPGPSRPCGPDRAACFRFRIPERYAGILARLGFDAATLANNHSSDFGEVGRTSTLRALTHAGLASTGLPGQAAARFVVRGKPVSLLGFAAFRGAEDLRDTVRYRTRIAEEAARGGLVIVSLHIGAEGDAAASTPRGREGYRGDDRGDARAAARLALQSGAHLVVGHGPHVPRGVEVVNGRLVVYSLGNFWAGPGLGIHGLAAFAPLLEVDLRPDGRLACARIHSLAAVRGRPPRPDPDEGAARLMARLTAADFPESEGAMFQDGIIAPTPVRCEMPERPGYLADATLRPTDDVTRLP